MTLDEFDREVGGAVGDMIARVARALKGGLEGNLDPNTMVAIINAHVTKTQDEGFMVKALNETLQ